MSRSCSFAAGVREGETILLLHEAAPEVEAENKRVEETSGLGKIFLAGVHDAGSSGLEG
jgi:hypothetical protein